ncbi:MAG: RNA polymerase sigma factor [Chloroflexi bacterium]|nr:MAG: RNA polymerase sigma factor [Chloroflexota bacterium]
MTGAALPPFQRLFDEHGGIVLRWLMTAVGPAEADDCFQETMLSALRAYPKLRDTSNLRGWLLTIARRKAIDAHRAGSRRPAALADSELEAAVGSGGAVSADADPAVWDAVRELPAKQRRAVVMRYAGDRSYEDIAGSMAISKDAARQNAHAGVRTLRRKLR